MHGGRKIGYPLHVSSENYDYLKKSLFMLLFSLLRRARQVMRCRDVTSAGTCHRHGNKEKPISLLEFQRKIDVDFVAIQPFNWKRRLLTTCSLRCGIVVFIYVFLFLVFCFCIRFVFTIATAIKRQWSRLYYCCAHRQPLLLVFWLLFYCMRHVFTAILALRCAEFNQTDAVAAVVVVDPNTVHCNLYPFAGGQFRLFACGNNNSKLLCCLTTARPACSHYSTAFLHLTAAPATSMPPTVWLSSLLPFL